MKKHALFFTTLFVKLSFTLHAQTIVKGLVSDAFGAPFSFGAVCLSGTTCMITKSNIYLKATRQNPDCDPLLQSRATSLWQSEQYFGGNTPAKIKIPNLKPTGPVTITINGVSADNLVGSGRGGIGWSEKIEKL